MAGAYPSMSPIGTPRLVEEQDAPGGARHGSGTQDPGSTADERHRRRGVVRGFPRWLRAPRRGAQPGDGPDRGDLERGLVVEVGQQPGQPFGEHGLAGARRPEQQGMVSTGRRRDERSDADRVPHDVRQVGHGTRHGRDRDRQHRVDLDRRQECPGVDRRRPQRVHAPDPDPADHTGLGQVADG
jgi:hypothetical protein